MAAEHAGADLSVDIFRRMGDVAAAEPHPHGAGKDFDRWVADNLAVPFFAARDRCEISVYLPVHALARVREPDAAALGAIPARA